MKKYIVRLSHEEREGLEQFVSAGKASARKLTQARILLKADQAEQGPGWTDEAIQEALDVGLSTIYRVRQRLVEEGLEAALASVVAHNKAERKLDGAAEAHLIATCCSTPPAGHRRWSLRLLASKVVELGYVDQISHESVRQVLKKTNSSRGGNNSGAFPRPMPPS